MTQLYITQIDKIVLATKWLNLIAKCKIKCKITQYYRYAHVYVKENCV